MQEYDDGWHPLGYISKTMSLAETRYDIHDREMLGVMHAVRAWRAELTGINQHFEVWSDHEALKWFSTKQKLNDRQIRWMQELQSFDFQIVYQPGQDNSAADALSRKAEVVQLQKEIQRASREMVGLTPDRFEDALPLSEAIETVAETLRVEDSIHVIIALLRPIWSDADQGLSGMLLTSCIVEANRQRLDSILNL